MVGETKDRDFRLLSAIKGLEHGKDGTGIRMGGDLRGIRLLGASMCLISLTDGLGPKASNRPAG